MVCLWDADTGKLKDFRELNENEQDFKNYECNYLILTLSSLKNYRRTHFDCWYKEVIGLPIAMVLEIRQELESQSLSNNLAFKWKYFIINQCS